MFRAICRGVREKERFSEHKGYVVNNYLNKATGYHFNQMGHSVSDTSVSILEKVNNRDARLRKERETFFMNKMNPRYKGMNRRI